MTTGDMWHEDGGGRQCAAVTRAGHRCRAYAVAGSPYCFWHAPELREQCREAQARGGRALREVRIERPRGGRVRIERPHEPVAITTPGEAVTVLERAAADLLELLGNAADMLGWLESAAKALRGWTAGA